MQTYQGWKNTPPLFLKPFMGAEDQSLEDQSLVDQSLAHLPSPLLDALMFACFAFEFVCRLYKINLITFKITLIISVNNLFSFSRM